LSGFEKVLARYGSPVEILADGCEPGLTALALIQPVRDRDRQEIAGPLGWRKRERWLYLGEPGVPLEVGEKGFVRANGRRFEVFSARRVDLGRESCHWWGILIPKEDEE